MSASILIRQKIPIQQILLDRIQEMLLSHNGLQHQQQPPQQRQKNLILLIIGFHCNNQSTSSSSLQCGHQRCRTSCKLRNYWRRASTHATSECVMPFADIHRANLSKRRQFTTRLFLFSCCCCWSTGQYTRRRRHTRWISQQATMLCYVMFCQFPRMGSFIPPFRSWKSSSWLSPPPFPKLVQVALGRKVERLILSILRFNKIK